jgi:hypothetical protein
MKYNPYNYSTDYSDAELAVSVSDEDMRAQTVITMQLLATIVLYESSMMTLPAFGTAAAVMFHEWYAERTFLVLAFTGLLVVAVELLLIQPHHSHTISCYWSAWWIWLVYSYISLSFWTDNDTSSTTTPTTTSYSIGFFAGIYTIVLHVALIVLVSMDIVGRSVLSNLRAVTLLLAVCFVVLIPIPFNNAFLSSTPQLTCHMIGATAIMIVVNIRERSQTCSLYERRIHTLVQIQAVLYSSGYFLIVVASIVLLQSWCASRSIGSAVPVRRI